MNNLKEDFKKPLKMPHNISLENRKNLIISGVCEVGSFNENQIDVITQLGKLSIKGENLNIKKLSLELGDLEIDGKIFGLIYKDISQNLNKGFFSKLFK